MDKRYSRWEQETVINYNNEERIATIYTRDPVIMKKLQKKAEKYPEHYICINRTDLDVTYECPKKYIKFYSPRILSDEQREKLRKNLKK